MNTKLISYNCKNVKRSVECVRRLCRSSDLVALQEHWLLPYDLPFLGTIDDDFAFTGTSAVDTSVGVLRGRPYGGVALLWRKSVFPMVTVVKCISVRLAAIKIVLSDRCIMVFSVYMPTDTRENMVAFTECMSEMAAIIESHDVESVLMLGDYNAHPALFYNVAHPGRIKILILLDGCPSLQRLQVRDPEEYYRSFYERYYDDYDRYNNEERVYSKRKALDAVTRARGLTEAQAGVVLSRNLRKVGDDRYKLSWDRRLRNAAPQSYPLDYYYQLFAANCPPTLLIQASVGSGYEKGKEPVARLLSQLQSLGQYRIVSVEGQTHDVHLTHPDRVAAHVTQFMEANCKL